MAKKAVSEEPMSETPSTAEMAPTPETESESAETPRKRARMKNKADAFRMAMAALGADAKPLQIQEWIRKKYGVTLKTTLLSTYKGTWLKQQQGETPSTTVAVAYSGTREATINDIREVRSILNRVGVEQFKQMLDLLGVH